MADELCVLCGGPMRICFRGARDPISMECFNVWACGECGLRATFPQPTELSIYYGARYYGMRHWVTTTYCSWRRIRVVNLTFDGFRRRSILDVGYGDGTFLQAARRKGWNISGTELHAAPATSATMRVWPSLKEIEMQFDCVSCWHVLEHLRDPVQSLLEMKRLLAPGGALLLAVPDADGWQSRLFGPFWFHLDVPRHLFHFDLPALHRLFATAGFHAAGIWHHELEYDLFGWIQSALNAMLRVPNVLFDFLTGKPRRTGYGPIVGSLLFAVITFPIAFVLTVVSTLARRGGTLIVAARPNEKGEVPQDLPPKS